MFRVILVSGSQSLKDAQWVKSILKQYPCQLMIFGDAVGVDTIAWEYCEENHIPYLCFEANWALYKKGAGVIRNEEMVRQLSEKDDLVLIFLDGATPGTMDTYKRAKKKRLNTKVFQYRNGLMGYVKAI